MNVMNFIKVRILVGSHSRGWGDQLCLCLACARAFILCLFEVERFFAGQYLVLIKGVHTPVFFMYVRCISFIYKLSNTA